MKIPLPGTAKRVLFTGIALFFLLGGYAAGPTRSEVITPQMRTEDARLEKPVHPLVAPRITVEALLQKLSAAEGVEITLHGSPKGPGQTEVFVILRDTSLADTLNGLCTLLSYDKARWRWTREGKAGNYRYLLWPSFALPQLIMDVQRQIQADFEAQDAKMEAALKMSPKELERAAKTDLNANSIYLEDKAGISKRRSLLNAYYGAFSPEQRLHILRGENVTPDKPVTSIVDGRAAPLQFRITFTPGNVGPALMIGVGENGGFSGSSCLGDGPTEELRRDRIADQWYFGGKPKAGSLEDKVIKRPAMPLPTPTEISAEAAESNAEDRFSPLWSLMWKTSEAVQVSILAVPTEPASAGGSFISAFTFPTEPYGMTLKELMTKLNRPAYSLRYQCQKNVLLLRDTSAPFTKRTAQPN